MADFVLARIKPYNPKQGYKVQTYTFMGQRFRESAGWYRIPVALGEQLKELLQDESDPLSQSVFDVLSEEDASKVEERENARRERASALRPNQSPQLRANDPRRTSVARAGVLTTADLQAPNDEFPPNGYPPPRVYPMPQPSGTVTRNTYSDIPHVTQETDSAVFDEAAAQGVDDKTLSVNAANIDRDQQFQAPVLIDGQSANPDDEPNYVAPGDTDFGPDALEGRGDGEEDAPASPPSGRRRRNR